MDPAGIEMKKENSEIGSEERGIDFGLSEMLMPVSHHSLTFAYIDT